LELDLSFVDLKRPVMELCLIGKGKGTIEKGKKNI